MGEEANAGLWMQVIASIGILTPLVVAILGFIERRSDRRREQQAAPVSAGEAVEPEAMTVTDVLLARIDDLQDLAGWLASERDYYHGQCVKAGLDVPAPRIRLDQS